MSFLDRINRVLRRAGGGAGEDDAPRSTVGAPYEAAVDDDGAEPDRRPAAESAPPSERLPDGRWAYAYGVAAGRREVDPEHFREYLESAVAGEAVEDRLIELNRRERELVAEAANVRERRIEATHRAANAEHLEQRVDRAEERLDAVEQELDDAESKRMDVRHSGLLTYFLIFCAAALAFILADIVITRTIVADALALTGRDFMGFDESWYFAFALAFLAILLKPAYDRLVEARYWDGESGWFIGVIVVASVLSLGTLGVLGWFRAVAFEAQTLGELALQQPDGEALAQWETFRNLQEQVVSSGWGKAAFVMSGVLFAVAGAISLGIGLRHFHDFRHVRLPLSSRMRRLKKQRKRLRQRLDRHHATLEDENGRLRRLRLRLEDLPALETIMDELRAVREERDTLRERRAELRRIKLESVYTDGYATGRRLDDARPGEPPAHEGPGERPHIAVRRRIQALLDTPHDVGAAEIDAGTDAGADPQSDADMDAELDAEREPGADADAVAKDADPELPGRSAA